MSDQGPRVAILGCGPAGLFAAHAAHIGGASEVKVFSKPRKSFMRGAQYLHRPIPGLSGKPFEVTYTLFGGGEGGEGGVEGYRRKVYGDMGDILVSPETLEGTSPAWDIREAYDAAWDLYGADVRDVDLSPGRNEFFYDWVVFNFDMVFTTVPATVTCSNPLHIFRSQRVWATEGLKRPHEYGFNLASGELRDNFVVCSGDPGDWWYRQSRIHGWENTEFPYNRRPRGDEHVVHEVVKPISTDCDCNMAIMRLGRYGKWTKGVLSHEAFDDVARVLVAAEQGMVE